MDIQPAYTTRQWNRAVNASAWMGWLALASPFGILGGWEWSILTAIIGLPIAFLAAWTIVAPILKRMMRHSISWTRAAFSGAGISLLIASVSTAIFRYQGWRQSQDPNVWSVIGGGSKISEIDGILTPYGWLVTAEMTAAFVMVGVAIALVLRGLIGPGRVFGSES